MAESGYPITPSASGTALPRIEVPDDVVQKLKASLIAP